MHTKDGYKGIKKDDKVTVTDDKHAALHFTEGVVLSNKSDTRLEIRFKCKTDKADPPQSGTLTVTVTDSSSCANQTLPDPVQVTYVNDP